MYAPDEKKSISKSEHLSCRYPNVGTRIYTGNYYLTVVPSFETNNNTEVFKNTKLNIGKYEFVEGTLRNGELKAFRFGPSKSRSNVILYSDAVCNMQSAHFFGYDFKQNKLVQYKFKMENGVIENFIHVGPGIEDIGVNDMEKTGVFETKYYNNLIGDIIVTKWRFSASDNMFYQIVE